MRQRSRFSKKYFDDTTLGTLSNASDDPVFGLFMGQTLYRLAESQLPTDLTPQYANGSLILTRARSLEHGVIGLDGGGVVVLPSASGAAYPIHIRLD